MFTRDFQVIVGSIAFVDSNETARTDIAALRDAPRTGSCLRKSLTALLSSSGGSAQVTVSQIRPPPTGPDGDVVAYRLRILAQGGGHTAPFVVDTVNARKGRAEVFVDFRDENQPIPADIEHRAVRAMLDRLGAGGR